MRQIPYGTPIESASAVSIVGPLTARRGCRLESGTPPSLSSQTQNPDCSLRSMESLAKCAMNIAFDMVDGLESAWRLGVGLVRQPVKLALAVRLILL